MVNTMPAKKKPTKKSPAKFTVLVTRLHENKPAGIWYEGSEKLAKEAWRMAERAAEMHDEIAVMMRGGLRGYIMRVSTLDQPLSEGSTRVHPGGRGDDFDDDDFDTGG